MNPSLIIAVVGQYLQGKSTLVNDLLAANTAKMGRGARTTSAVTEFTIPHRPGVTILDTPGKDANALDDKAASEASMRSSVVLILHPKDMDKRYRSIVSEASGAGRHCISIFNCMTDNPPTRWDPMHLENQKVCENIERDLREMRDVSIGSFLPIDGKIVYPVNVLWARFGLGLFRNGNEEDCQFEQRIRHAAVRIGIPINGMTDEEFRRVILARSGFLLLENFLKNLPLELLKHAVTHPEQEINRIVDCFAAEFKKRWTAA